MLPLFGFAEGFTALGMLLIVYGFPFLLLIVIMIGLMRTPDKSETDVEALEKRVQRLENEAGIENEVND